MATDYTALFSAISPKLTTAKFFEAEPAPAPAPTMAPTTEPTTDYTALFSAIAPNLTTATFLKAETAAPTMAPTTDAIADRCPADEYWDKIEQACYPNDPPEESGFSPAPEPEPTATPIPESDGVPNGGDTTVTRPPPINRTSPTGPGSPSSYPYPGSGGGRVPSAIDFSPVSVAAPARPLYKNPYVLLGGAVLVAYLVLRK